MSIINCIYFLADGADVLNPVYEGMRLIGPYALGAVFALSMFYGLFLGVKYAKCQAEDERLNVQKTLINFIIGIGTVIVLICVLFAIRVPLGRFIDNG